MKKIIVYFSILTVILSMFVACSDKNDDSESASTTTHSISYIDENYSMTKPQHTVGSPKTSEKYGSDDNAYVIVHYDENGYVAKEDVYENGKMAYYYVVTGTDEVGNAIQIKYYTPQGKFVAYYDNTFFFDEKGNKISETSFETLLGIKR